MPQVHVNPEELRTFAARLQACSDAIAEEAASTSAAFASLGDTWNDDKRVQFEADFEELRECVRRFTASCDEHVPHLYRLADRITDYENS